MSNNPFAKKAQKKQPVFVGDVRENQILNTFGIGSIVEFVKHTVIIAGVDDWDENSEEKIHHRKLAAMVGVDYFLPPSAACMNKTGDIQALLFPSTFHCPICKKILPNISLKPDGSSLHCPLTRNGKRCRAPLLPSRFVVTCDNGHMEDFPYSWWVHKSDVCSSGKREPQISMFNVGNRSDLESLYLKCEDCGQQAKMSDAFLHNAFHVKEKYSCRSQYPHLKEGQIPDQEPCSMHLKTRLRSSSGVYFPVCLSAISIPPWSELLVQYLEKERETLDSLGKEEALSHIRQVIYPQLKHKFTLDSLLLAYQLIQEQEEEQVTEESVYLEEYQVLCQGDVQQQGEYAGKTVPLPEEFRGFLRKVVAVEKLAVVQTLLGFTRGAAWSSGDIRDPRIVPLSQEKKTWLPGMKLHGEGIFLEFQQDALDAWAESLGNRYEKIKDNLDESHLNTEKFSPQYVFLHSFSHLFIRALSDVCGYHSASIQEKIYSTMSGKGDMCGVLVYLVSTDSQGSLGGLIQVAEEKLTEVFHRMLQDALWCSGDPLCSNATHQGANALNYAACHDCLLLPETSCEMNNSLLDRVSVVGLPQQRELGFLGDYVQQLL